MAPRRHSIRGIGAPIAVCEFGGLRFLEAAPVGSKPLANPGNNRRDFLGKPAMTCRVLGACPIEIEMEFHNRGTPAVHRPLDDSRTTGVVRPAHFASGRFADTSDGGEIRLI